MKKSLLTVACLTLIASGSAFAGGDINANYDQDLVGSTSNLKPGVGFSTAKQQITPQACYVAGTPSYSTSGELSFSDAQTFDQLEKSTNIDVSEHAGIGKFSESADMKYMRSIKNTDTSMSVNYAQTIVQHVSFPVTGLTPYGKTTYLNDKNQVPLSPNFDMMCGNHYVTEYDQGALLIASFNIHFATKQQKQTFEAHISGNYGAFGADGNIERIASQYHLKGTVSVKAMQIGGKPELLAQILNGGRATTECSITNMSACRQTAQDIVNYAANNFSKQVTVSGRSISGSYSPLPINIPQDTESIANLGIQPLKTVITPEISADRIALANDLNENEYYYNHFNTLLTQYPVAWDTSSHFYGLARQAEGFAITNLHIILKNPLDIEDSAIQCYNSPTLCPQITKAIEPELNPITPSYLGFLSAIKVAFSGPINQSGEYYAGTNWKIYTSPGAFPPLSDINSLSYTPTTFHMTSQQLQYSANLTSTNGKKYCGYEDYTIKIVLPIHYHIYVCANKITSPYYFTAYSS